MNLIIDISDDDYKFIKDLQFHYSCRRSGMTIERNVINAIKNGKPYEERPTGEWVEDSGNIACSHCHTIWLYRRTVFCPNCGAEMRGDNNNGKT